MKKTLLTALMTLTILTLTACGNETVRQVMGENGEPQTEHATIEETEDTESMEALTETTEETTEEDGTETGTDLANAGDFPVDSRTDATTNKDGEQIVMNAAYQYYWLSGTPKNGSAEVVAKINEAIWANLTKVEDQAAAQRADAWKAYEHYVNYEEKPEDKKSSFKSYTLNYKCKLLRNDEAVLSICYRMDTFTQGEHGDYSYHCMNFDAQTGELLTWENISEDSDAFSQMIVNQVTELSQKEEYQKLLFTDGTGDLAAAVTKADAWALTPNGMEIVADPYVLGPYSSGAIVFPIAYDSLAGMKEQYIYK